MYVYLKLSTLSLKHRDRTKEFSLFRLCRIKKWPSGVFSIRIMFCTASWQMGA